MHNGNGDTAIKRVTSVTSMILGVSAVITLIVYLYGAQVFASKDEICYIKDNYVRNDILDAKIETINANIKAIGYAVGARIR